jgi:hypothetical protein
MDVFAPRKLIALGEAYHQARQLGGPYALREAWARMRSNRIVELVPPGMHAETDPTLTPMLFVTATCAPGSPTPIAETTPEPDEMRLLKDRHGWQRIRHGVYCRVLGTMRPA